MKRKKKKTIRSPLGPLLSSPINRIGKLLAWKDYPFPNYLEPRFFFPGGSKSQMKKWWNKIYGFRWVQKKKKYKVKHCVWEGSKEWKSFFLSTELKEERNRQTEGEEIFFKQFFAGLWLSFLSLSLSHSLFLCQNIKIKIK